jgi:hypothetical protein
VPVPGHQRADAPGTARMRPVILAGVHQRPPPYPNEKGIHPGRGGDASRIHPAPLIADRASLRQVQGSAASVQHAECFHRATMMARKCASLRSIRKVCDAIGSDARAEFELGRRNSGFRAALPQSGGPITSAGMRRHLRALFSIKLSPRERALAYVVGESAFLSDGAGGHGAVARGSPPRPKGLQEAGLATCGASASAPGCRNHPPSEKTVRVREEIAALQEALKEERDEQPFRWTSPPLRRKVAWRVLLPLVFLLYNRSPIAIAPTWASPSLRLGELISSSSEEVFGLGMGSFIPGLSHPRNSRGALPGRALGARRKWFCAHFSISWGCLSALTAIRCGTPSAVLLGAVSFGYVAEADSFPGIIVYFHALVHRPGPAPARCPTRAGGRWVSGLALGAPGVPPPRWMLDVKTGLVLAGWRWMFLPRKKACPR